MVMNRLVSRFCVFGYDEIHSIDQTLILYICIDEVLDHEFHKSAKLISTLSLLTNQYN